MQVSKKKKKNYNGNLCFRYKNHEKLNRLMIRKEKLELNKNEKRSGIIDIDFVAFSQQPNRAQKENG